MSEYVCPKPPVFLPDWMVHDWGILPLASPGWYWRRDENRMGYILTAMFMLTDGRRTA